ncbi:HsdM family class I SAM-dependent methyltransferase [Fusobacterium perfoetens]|uniref:HsdM family class I SAM-dependent methyltransferase n=1 Tax=Fusobacterium perfoetens TaxID=852 RepID=UPI00048269B6|nr:N-6 DNA methylase [Fusobacterium perfoetens]
MSKVKVSRERNVDTKIVPTLLKKLGYKDDDWEADYPLSSGRTTVAADFLVSSNREDTENAINLIIESKKDTEILSNYIDQAVSYGRLVKARYSILINTNEYIVISNNNKKEIMSGKVSNLNKVFIETFKKENYFKRENLVCFSSIQISEAQKIVNTIESVKDFNKILIECQDIIRNNDGLTGSDAFDELSKILFIKIYLENCDKNFVFSTKKILENNKDGINWTKNQFDNVKKEYSLLFEKDESIALKQETVSKIVEKLEKYDLKHTNVDIKGNAYEILLGKTFIGSLGQHFTPRTVVNFMLEMLNPVAMMNDSYIPTIIDPSCGTGGFLVRCLELYLEKAKQLKFDSEKIKQIREKSIYGIDLNPRAAKVTKMNLSLHGDGHGSIYTGNGLEEQKGIEGKKFDIILTNPPFGVQISEEKILKKFSYSKTEKGQVKKSADSTYLFMEHCLNLLNETGKIGIVLPNGILNNSNDKKSRENILKNISIDALISLPNKSFKFAKANACTSILFGNKILNHDKYIFMALPEEIGYERVTQYASEIKQNDFFPILKEYNNYCINKKIYETNDKEYIILSEKPITFLIRRDLVTSKRLDASYYYSEYIFHKHISTNCVRLSIYAKEVERNLLTIKEPIKYIEIKNIVPAIGNICSYSIIENEKERPSRAKRLLQSNEIIAARMTDCEKNVAIVSEQYQNSLATNGFIHLIPIPPMTTECLYYLLRSDFNTQQIRWKSSNTIMPSIYEEEYLNNWMPKLSIEQIKQITKRIKNSIEKLQKSINDFDIEINNKLY